MLIANISPSVGGWKKIGFSQFFGRRRLAGQKSRRSAAKGGSHSLAAAIRPAPLSVIYFYKTKLKLTLL